jgi:alpha-mannosidase
MIESVTPSQLPYLENVLNEAVNLIDLRTPYNESFYQSIAAARRYLAKALYTDLAGHEEVIASCIGHTHIDVAWWWTVAQTREKVCRSFATVLKLMDEYPNYKFMSSQPQLYYFLKQRYPELYEQIKQRVAEGRWEPEGGMWVEADCNLTSGESLVRQFLYGKRFFKEEFGVDNRILWLPDVFGYSGALPQIMAKCGIDYFMTTKLAWNQFNKMPYDTFKWRGIDGTEILTHLVTTLGVGQSENDFFTTYNGILHPDALIGGWHRYQQKDINNDILISYGYGDGGGGPTRAMLETSTRMEKGIEGLPKVRQAFARTYFDELAERVKDNRRLPTWEGELYFEYHRGTYTSMARNKRSNRKIELHMMDLELLSLLAQAKVAYPEAEIDKLWHGILINQFHDILPGSSIHEVYEVTKKEYAEMEAEITALREERLDALTPAGEGVTVYNTTGFVRSDVVELGDCKAEALQDEAGNIYPVQKTADGAVAFLNNLPAKGSKTFAVVPAHGQMTGIFDKENRREVLKPGQAGNLFRVYEDKPIYYDNWDIDIFYTEKFWDVTDLQDFTWTENGPVRATLHIERNYSNSTLVQDIHFYAKQRRIEFVTTVDWHEHQSLLKVHFPVNVHTDEATFEIQYGNLTRKTHANTSWDRARFESCGQKWMDLSEGHYGVSMLNDCKYGHSVRDSVIGLTLIKSGIEPNPTTDQEVHHFTYAIYPHAEKWQAAGTVPQAFFLNQPALAVQGGKPGESFSLVGLDAPNVVLETIKRAEDGDGAIVRMYECENSLTNVTLDWNLPFHAAESCNCLEQPDGEPVEVKDGKITFTVKPYEIKTIRIR